MHNPLGTSEEEYEKRNSGHEYWKKFSAWRKGYRAGKEGKKREDNPYQLSPDEWEFLRKRTRWMLGWEEGAFTPSRSQLKKEKKAKKEELRRIKRIAKEKSKHKHKHKHKRHHHGH